MPRGPVRIITLGLVAIALFFFIFGSSSSTSKATGTYSYVLTTSEKWQKGLSRYTNTEKWKIWHSTNTQPIAVTEEKIQTNRPSGDKEQKDALKLAQAEDMAKANAAGHRLLPVATHKPSHAAADVEDDDDDNDYDYNVDAKVDEEVLGDGLMRQVMKEEHEDLLRASNIDTAPAPTAAPAKQKDVAADTTSAPDTTLVTSTRTSKPTKAVAPVAIAADNSLSKAIVLAKPNDKSAAWIKEEFSDWNAIIYNISSTATRIVGSTVPLRGGSALAFLTHIIEHYNELPDIILFISTIPLEDTQIKNSWLAEEKDYKAQLTELAPTLHTMNTSYIQANGYTSLRCDPDPGCTENTVIKPLDTFFWGQPWHHDVATAYRTLFPTEPKVPAEISSPAAGAQFAVSKAQIYSRSRAEYTEMRTFVQETRMDEGTLQRVMSALWHVVFSKPPVNCPDQDQCLCEFWGRCDAADDAAAAATDGNAVGTDGRVIEDLKAKDV